MTGRVKADYQEKRQQKKVILSASRMTDMPKYYPQAIIEEVEKRLSKGMDIHTLVLWTKHPRSLLLEPLYSYLMSLKNRDIQLFSHITITGLGGVVVGKRRTGQPLILEPKAPPMEESISALPEVIGLMESPLRIRLRIDPIVRILDYEGKEFSNLHYLPLIIGKASALGLTNFCFSLLEKNMHQKVERRFNQLGCQIIETTAAERKKLAAWLKKIAGKYGVSIAACCVPGFAESRCIDGYLLQELHADKAAVDLTEPRRRERCGCTSSIDLGGWPVKKCPTGCEYCYARSDYCD